MQKILLIFLLLPLFLQAQTGFNIGAEINVSKTVLFNNDDIKAKEGLDLLPTYGYQVGLDIGYRIESRIGFVGINAGIRTVKCGQNYKGQKIIEYNPTAIDTADFTASTNLKYYKFPLEISFAINPNRQLRPFISVGVYYAINTFYEDIIEEQTCYTNLKGYLKVSKLDYDNYSKDLVTNNESRTVGTLDKPYYNKKEFGINSKLGAEYEVSKNLCVRLQLEINKGLTDVENKTKITLTKSNSQSSQTVLEPWKDLYHKYYKHGQFGGPYPERNKTTNLMMGITLSIQYFINNKN